MASKSHTDGNHNLGSHFIARNQHNVIHSPKALFFTDLLVILEGRAGIRILREYLEGKVLAERTHMATCDRTWLHYQG